MMVIPFGYLLRLISLSLTIRMMKLPTPAVIACGVFVLCINVFFIVYDLPEDSNTNGVRINRRMGGGEWRTITDDGWSEEPSTGSEGDISAFEFDFGKGGDMHSNDAVTVIHGRSQGNVS